MDPEGNPAGQLGDAGYPRADRRYVQATTAPAAISQMTPAACVLLLIVITIFPIKLGGGGMLPALRPLIPLAVYARVPVGMARRSQSP